LIPSGFLSVRSPAVPGPEVGAGAGAALVRTVFAQPDAASAWPSTPGSWTSSPSAFPAAAELLVDAAADLLAFTAFPKEHWRQTRSNIPRSG
jgi:putative transposase